MDRFVRAVRALSQVSGVVATLLILVSILVVCQMIVARGLFGLSAYWQTEFVTYALVAATFIGAPYILMTRGHVNVDVLPLLLGHRGRVALALAGALVALGFCLLVFWSSLDWWYQAYNSGRVTSSMWRARLWIPYLSVPVGAGLLCLQYVADIWALLAGRALPFGLKPDERW